MKSLQWYIDYIIASPGGYQNNEYEYLNFYNDPHIKSEIIHDDVDTQVNELTYEIREWCEKNRGAIC